MSNNQPLTRRPDNTTPSIVNRLQNWVMSRGRYGRMTFVFIGALALAMLMMPVVDLLFFRLTGAYIGESSVPSWIVMIFCFGSYISGYVFVIGIPGQTPEESRPQRIYILTIFAIIILSIVWYTVQIAAASSGA